MSSVYFPVHVALLLRRLVNIFSTLSISNQYLVQKARIDDCDKPEDLGEDPAWRAVDILRAGQWNWWKNAPFWSWRDGVSMQRIDRLPPELADRLTLNSPASSFPWFRGSWSWPSMSSLSGDRSSASGNPSDPPPDNPDQKRNEHRNTPKKHTPNKKPEPEPLPESQDTIHLLLRNPVLYDPVRAPRYPIVLCHGLYGFDSRGPTTFPSLRSHYWSNVLNTLKNKVGADVIVTSVPGTGSIASRAESMDRFLQEKARGRGINFLAHSMGGLDCRHLITHLKPQEYTPLSLLTVCTPHRGSPFMDWCAENIGIGKIRQQERVLSNSFPLVDDIVSNSSSLTPVSPTSDSDIVSKPKPKADATFSLPSLSSLPSSFTTALLSALDSPAYANLTTAYLTRVFNPSTPDDPRVRYFSVASRTAGVSVWHPFWLTKMVVDAAEAKARALWKVNEQGERQGHDGNGAEWGNDGLVTVQSAKWGEFLGVMEGCDHWEMRGARGLELGVDVPSLPLSIGADGWGIGDWGRFVSAWKKQERREDSDKRERHSSLESNEKVNVSHMDGDAALKASTDKLSAVFDWIIDQVPQKSAAAGQAQPAREKRSVRNELATKLDLERFFVALTRKLYNEGL